MCSPGGWIGNAHRAVELRYLRKERPVASDLTPPRRWDPKQYAAQQEERARDYEDYKKRYAAATGEICGNVVAENAKDGNAGIISFLFAGGFSPFEKPITNVGADGSFCRGGLAPENISCTLVGTQMKSQPMPRTIRECQTEKRQ